MQHIADLLKHFFTHKDYLPSADQIAGTLFTPLHVLFAVLCAAAVAVGCISLAKKKEHTIKTVFAILWVLLVVLEAVKMMWETCAGEDVYFEWAGMLPLYPCSIFLYTLPFAVWGRGRVRRAACGYICTLGLLGGTINFVYPANILGNYSCISFAGFHTFLFHGTMVLCALVMLLSGYHTFIGAQKWQDLLLPAVPCLIVSLAANAVNFSPIGADYMFFKLNSFFMAPLGKLLPDWLAVVVVYVVYLLIHGLPYLPSYIAYRKRLGKNKEIAV